MPRGNFSLTAELTFFNRLWAHVHVSVRHTPRGYDHTESGWVLTGRRQHKGTLKNPVCPMAT